MSTRLAHLPLIERLKNTRLAEKLWNLVGSVGIRTKILGIVLALTIILGLGVTWQVRIMLRATLTSELEDRGASLISDLAARTADPILLNDTFAVYELLTETKRNHPDVVYAFVIDKQGEVLAHTFDDGFPSALLVINRLTGDSAQEFHYDSQEGHIHEFAAPIFSGQAGVVRLGLGEARLQQVINAVTGQLLLTTLLVALVGVLAATFLTWLLSRPILQLVETTRQVGQGNLNVRAPHWANDEIGALADAFNQMVADLAAGRQAIAEKEAARSRLLAQLINAQEEERRRIARELHDGVGQSLTSMMVGLKLIDNTNSPDTLTQARRDLRRIAAETLDDVRLLSRDLRPAVLDDMGLAAALERYAAEFDVRYPHLTVDVHCQLPQRLPTAVETSLYRVVQEAMTNAARHSGAKVMSVLLSTRNNCVQVIVEDDGRGFNPETARRNGGSVGLHSMAERTELMGGQLNIESGPDGTTVYVEVPV